MKVLWICNIMLPAVAEYFGREGSNKEGWLSGLCSIILERQHENQIELHVAFPVEKSMSGYIGEVVTEDGKLHCYGFYENVIHAEQYGTDIEAQLRLIMDTVNPDVIHCFGTEYAHTLAALRCAPHPERVLVGIQGLCGVIAEAYMADLPKRVQKTRTFRDILKRDSLLEQQKKFEMRGQREKEIFKLAQNVTGRTDFDRTYAEKANPQVRYFAMNETLRPCFYAGKWVKERCVPYSIFIAQGDYPLKGLHYLLVAAAKLKERYPKLQIYVAGNSLVNYETIRDRIKISGYGKYLRELIEKYDLEERVHFTGKLSAAKMLEQYIRSSVFVCCSANENSPNSLGEAMMLGMPCVAAAVGGIPNLFTDGEDGVLYEGYERTSNSDINNKCNQKRNGNKDMERISGNALEKIEKNEEISRIERNAENLCRAISRIWENPEETQRFCENARKHARKTHDREENYYKMMEIYASIARE